MTGAKCGAPDEGDAAPEFGHGDGRARIHEVVEGEGRFVASEGWDALILPLGRGARSISPRHSRGRDWLTLVPADGRSLGNLLPMPARAAVFEMRRDFLEEACATSPLRFGPELTASSRKVALLAERLLRLDPVDAAGGVVAGVLWIALARGAGSLFGGMRVRPGDGWLNPGALQRTVEMVETGLGGELPVARLSEAAGLSPSAFLRAFRGSVGATPGEFVLRRRTALGARLLATTDLPIGEIARRTGFKSGNHFATTFASRQGISPSAYRRARRTMTA